MLGSVGAVSNNFYTFIYKIPHILYNYYIFFPERKHKMYNSVCGETIKNISKVMVGCEETAELLLTALLCGGHVLLEDLPGTGKTMLVKSLAASLDLDFKRIQFTPDLLPSDITGVNFFNMKRSEFEFIKGPVFTNILLADEINRAAPKTQSGLLECMEERQVTVDGVAHRLEQPFMVVATQNPIESLGVFPLPEAQLDRFLIKTSLPIPNHEEKTEILRRFNGNEPLASLSSVASAKDIEECRRACDNIFVHRDIMSYIAAICEATGEAENVILGAGTRAMIALMRASKAFAFIRGRKHVLPDDVKLLAPAVLSHRLILTSSARMKKNSAAAVIKDILRTVPVPTESYLDGI